MKILMVNKFFYRRGGSEAYMLELRSLLKKAGHQVIDFSMSDKRNFGSAFSRYFIKHIELGKREGLFKDLKKAGHLIYSFEAKRKLAKLIKKEKPDIIHLHNFCFQLSPSILRTIKRYKIPTIWTLHDYKIICPNQILFTQGKVCERCKIHKYYNCFSYRCIHNKASQSFLAMVEMYLHKLIFKSYQVVDIFVAPSQFLAQKIIAWKMPVAKIRQLYYFIDLERIKPSQEAGEGIVYVGRLSKEKGILTLLAAMKGFKGINLQIIGEGPQKKPIQRYLKRNKLTNVALTGYKNKEELLELVKKSRLVIVPSIWYENNPVVILEAFALAKPVIGSDLGGIPELVKDGQTGFCFKAGDAKDLQQKIYKAYKDSGLLKRMGANARQLVEKIADPQKHLQQIIKFYNEISKYEK